MKSLFAGYPNEAAVHVALGTVRQKLEKLKEEKQVQYTLQCYLSYSVQQKKPLKLVAIRQRTLGILHRIFVSLLDI